MSFYSSRHVKARKSHHCEQCPVPIDIGTEHIYSCGNYEGDFYTHRQHLECNAAASAYAHLHGLYGDEWPWFHDGEICSEPEARKWMKDNHPLVYERLGWAAIDKRYEDEDATL